jgi:hypothetical protein
LFVFIGFLIDIKIHQEANTDLQERPPNHQDRPSEMNGEIDESIMHRMMLLWLKVPLQGKLQGVSCG